MPMDKKRYPACWDEVAGLMKRLNDWECASCGRPCRRPGESDDQLRRRIKRLSKKSKHNWAGDLDDMRSGKPKLGRFTLTVAHLDHDPPNIHPDNLRPWCSVCHCIYDLTPMAMARKIKLKLEYEGQLSLF